MNNSNGLSGGGATYLRSVRICPLPERHHDVQRLRELPPERLPPPLDLTPDERLPPLLPPENVERLPPVRELGVLNVERLCPALERKLPLRVVERMLPELRPKSGKVLPRYVLPLRL